MAQPGARFVAPLRRSVEPLVHAPEAVQSARVGGIGVIDDAVLERERAHARPLARVGGHVGASHGSVLSGSGLTAGFWLRVAPGGAGPVVVFDGSLALLLLGD